jgi:hypothetical protein
MIQEDVQNGHNKKMAVVPCAACTTLYGHAATRVHALLGGSHTEQLSQFTAHLSRDTMLPLQGLCAGLADKGMVLRSGSALKGSAELLALTSRWGQLVGRIPGAEALTMALPERLAAAVDATVRSLAQGAATRRMEHADAASAVFTQFVRMDMDMATRARGWAQAYLTLARKAFMRAAEMGVPRHDTVHTLAHMAVRSLQSAAAAEPDGRVTMPQLLHALSAAAEPILQEYSFQALDATNPPNATASAQTLLQGGGRRRRRKKSRKPRKSLHSHLVRVTMTVEQSDRVLARSKLHPKLKTMLAHSVRHGHRHMKHMCSRMTVRGGAWLQGMMVDGAAAAQQTFRGGETVAARRADLQHKLARLARRLRKKGALTAKQNTRQMMMMNKLERLAALDAEQEVPLGLAAPSSKKTTKVAAAADVVEQAEQAADAEATAETKDVDSGAVAGEMTARVVDSVVEHMAQLRDYVHKFVATAEGRLDAASATNAASGSWWGKVKSWGGKILKGPMKAIVWLLDKSLDMIEWILRHPVMASVILTLIRLVLGAICRWISIRWGMVKLKRDATAGQRVRGAASGAVGLMRTVLPGLLYEYGTGTQVGDTVNGMLKSVGQSVVPLMLGVGSGIPYIGSMLAPLKDSMEAVVQTAFQFVTPKVRDALLGMAFLKSSFDSVHTAGGVVYDLAFNCLRTHEAGVSEMANLGDETAAVLRDFYARHSTEVSGWFARATAFAQDPSRDILPEEIAWAQAQAGVRRLKRRIAEMEERPAELSGSERQKLGDLRTERVEASGHADEMKTHMREGLKRAAGQ